MSSYPTMVILYTFLACLLLSFFIKLRKNSFHAKGLPPGPPRLPLIGNLHQLGNPLHKTLPQLANKYGDLMFLQLGSVPTIVISSANMVREIFKTHDLVFSGRPQTYTVKKLSYNCSTISFAPYGDQWRELRRIAMLELLTPKRVQCFQAIRDEEVTSMLDSIANSPGPINLSELTHVLSNNVLCRLAFGKKFTRESDGRNKLRDMLQESQDLLASPCLSDFFPSMEWVHKFSGLESRLEKAFRKLDELYSKVLEEHLDPIRPNLEQEDLVDVLLRAHQDPTQAPALSMDSVKGVMADMYTAGTDTSAATLLWTMTELIRNPSVMRRAQDEVRKAMKGKEKVEENDLSQLIYLKLIVKESFRFHPPAPLLIPRETTEACVIKGYKIPAKTRVLIETTSIFMDPKLWESPHEFRPERFLDSSIDFRGQHFEFIPFGIGRRGCPGTNFAVPLIELALANLLHRFDWKLPHGMTKDDLDMEEASGITMTKKVPLYLVASPVN